MVSCACVVPDVRLPSTPVVAVLNTQFPPPRWGSGAPAPGSAAPGLAVEEGIPRLVATFTACSAAVCIVGDTPGICGSAILPLLLDAIELIVGISAANPTGGN